MKKIVRQLKKLLNTHIILENEFSILSSGKEFTSYKVYIGGLIGKKIYTYSWSNSFTTIKELDKHLSEKIPNYKRVYND